MRVESGYILGNICPVRPLLFVTIAMETEIKICENEHLLVSSFKLNSGRSADLHVKAPGRILF